MLSVGVGPGTACPVRQGRVGAAQRRSSHSRLLLALCVLLTAAVTACTAVDSTLNDRGTAVNVGSGNLREDSILLNIVRASRFEPMNFMALSKYNASGILEGNLQVTSNQGLLYDILNKGAIQAGTTATTSVVKSAVIPSAKMNTSANFDVAPLENQDFYGQFLSPLDMATINLLVNAGISRELVLHSIVKGVRVIRADGTVFEYQNDPPNDSWLGREGPESRRQCEQLRQSNALGTPFANTLWSGQHARDCVYQKFLYFLRAALEYGMTTQPQMVPNPLAKTDKNQPKMVSRVVMCFDPAVAQEYNRTVHPSLACGSGRFSPTNPIFRSLGPQVKGILPVMRSPYAVFQYYGRLLATDSTRRVELFDARTIRLPTGDSTLLTINKDMNRDCFARAYHESGMYCVPNQGANNTKQVFVLLNVLVNLSTKRNALPLTPTVYVAPQ